MNMQERLQQQLGALMLANIQLASENAALQARVAVLEKQAEAKQPKTAAKPDQPKG